MFLHNEQVPEISGAIKKGAFLKLKGVTTIDKFDHEITIGSLAGIRKSVILPPAGWITVRKSE